MLSQTFYILQNWVADKKIRFSDVLPLAVGAIAFSYTFYAALFLLPLKINNVLFFLLFLIGATGFLYYQNRIIQVLTALVITAWFFLPMTWYWRGLTFDYGFFMGLFPLNDGIQYLTDAYRLLAGLDFTHISTRRPIFSGLLTFLLWISGNNLQVALGIFAVNTGLSVYILANEIRKWLGPISAGLVSVMLFYCYQEYEGRIMTENIGLSLGALSLAILINAAHNKNLLRAMIGTFILSLALNARAGAFFSLITLILWGGYFFREKLQFSWKAVIALTLATFLGFALNYLLVKTIGSSKGALFSNFSYTLYGLAAGYKGWGYIYSVEPNPAESQILSMALELIRQNPFNLVYGVFRAFLDYLMPEIMFSYLNFKDQQPLISYVLYILTILGIVRAWQSRKEPNSLLSLALFIGCFLSVSFVPPIDSGIRALTATMPVNAIITAYAVKTFVLSSTGESRSKPYAPAIYALFLAVLCLLGPWSVQLFAKKPINMQAQACPTGYTPISIQIARGSYIEVVEVNKKYGFIPKIRKKEITTRFKDETRQNFPSILDEFQGLYVLFKNLQPGETLAVGINQYEYALEDGPAKLIFLVAKTEDIIPGEVNLFCGQLAEDPRLRLNRFYYDIAVKHKE